MHRLVRSGHHVLNIDARGRSLEPAWREAAYHRLSVSETDEIRRQRVRRLVSEILPPLVFPDSEPLEIRAHFVKGEPITPVEAFEAGYELFPLGSHWGGAWSTAWFRLEGRIPARFGDREVVARIDLGYHDQPGFGGEGLVYLNGAPWQGVNSRHRSVTLARQAGAGESVLLYVEAAANPYVPWGGIEWPPLLPDYDGAPLYRLERAELAVRDSELESALRDLQVLSEVASALGPGDPRARETLVGLDRVARAVDHDDVRSSVLAARGLWEPLFDDEGRPHESERARHRVTAVGHAHIDSAWLWPIRETRRKCARTFATALRLMEENADFVFVCSQAQQHAFVEEDHPELFEALRLKAATGQFEPVGSMWVEPDTNIPSGESLVRQLVHGKRYFLERYGVETEDCWLPDAFGYSGNLPQILASAGVRYFLTQKLSWNEVDRFPHHTFVWEGIDGTRVLAHCPPTDTYNGTFHAAQLLKGERDFAEHGVTRRSLYAYGYGDGGGGPTEEMLERYRRLRRLEEFAGVRLGTAAGFFADVEREALESQARLDATLSDSVATAHSPAIGGLPIWVGELYLEKHRAVQTTQAALKLANRRCEALLREAELWSTAAPGRYPREELDELWKTVLLHQFHDILPGSSIQWVNDQAAEVLTGVGRRLDELVDRALAGLVSPAGGSEVVVFNAASHARSAVLEIDLGEMGAAEARTLSGSDGASPLQRLGEGRALAYAAVEGLGWSSFRLSDQAVGEWPHAVSAERRGEEYVLSNEHLEIVVDMNGEVRSVVDRGAGGEVVAAGERANVLQIHDDFPNDADAWDVDAACFERARELSGTDSIALVEEGPLRVALRVERSFGSSSIVQHVRLSAGSRHLEVACEVDWQERHKFLKVAFPVAVRAPAATFEIQFGHIERPTHANTSWDAARFEVAAQRWADLSEPGFGVALLNDCKYGYDVRANVIRLSLLRGPTWPDPDADRGRHRFSYGLLPHRGLATDASTVVDEAEAFNTPLRVVHGRPSNLPPSGSVVDVDGAAVSVVKTADDGDGLVVRLYEARGAHGTASLRLGNTAVEEAIRCDALERTAAGTTPIEPATDGSIPLLLRPFELVSLRIRTAPRT
jgi:alpha-mannosidase